MIVPAEVYPQAYRAVRAAFIVVEGVLQRRRGRGERAGPAHKATGVGRVPPCPVARGMERAYTLTCMGGMAIKPPLVRSTTIAAPASTRTVLSSQG